MDLIELMKDIDIEDTI